MQNTILVVDGDPIQRGPTIGAIRGALDNLSCGKCQFVRLEASKYQFIQFARAEGMLLYVEFRRERRAKVVTCASAISVLESVSLSEQFMDASLLEFESAKWIAVTSRNSPLEYFETCQATAADNSERQVRGICLRVAMSCGIAVIVTVLISFVLQRPLSYRLGTKSVFIACSSFVIFGALDAIHRKRYRGQFFVMQLYEHPIAFWSVSVLWLLLGVLLASLAAIVK